MFKTELPQSITMKSLLAASVILALGACSSSDDNTATDNNTGTDVQPPVVTEVQT